MNVLKPRSLFMTLIIILSLLAGCSAGSDQPGLDLSTDEEIMQTEDSSVDEAPEESEDNGLPGFLTLVYSETGDLWVAVGYNAPRQITSGHFDLYPILSPDGTKVLFQREVESGSAGLHRFELWVISTDGSDERRLVSAADLPGQMGYTIEAEEETMLDRLPQQVAWLDDSRRIAFNTLLEAGYGVLSFYDLWIADTETGTVTRLLEDGDGGSFGLVAIASEEPFFADPYMTVWRLPLSGEAAVLSTLPGINLFNTMYDKLWNSTRTAFAYIDNLLSLHITTLDGESLYVYDNGDHFLSWSVNDRYWIYRQNGEIMLDEVELTAAPLDLLAGGNSDWFEVKWVSGTDYVALSGNYHEGMTLWTGQVGGDSIEISAGVNSFDALWIE